MPQTAKFNAAISTLGISEPKVQQAIMKLLENSLWQRGASKNDRAALEEQIRLIRQKLSTIDFDIDEQTAQKIADKISAAIGDSVRTCTTAATTATNKAGEASQSAESASEDAAAVAQALADMEGTIEQKAQQAAETAISQVTQNVQQAVGQAQSAAQGAQNAANAATQSAQNAATTAGQATAAAQQATQAVKNLAFRSLAGANTYNASNDQYRKIATLPAVSSAAGASITFFGSLGGWTESSLRQVMVSICQRQSGTSYEAIDAIGYCFRASLPSSADICIYKESNNTFSVYLKGVKATYFKHNLGMIYNEQVTPVEDTFRTNTPTGTLVWNLLAHCKVIATADEVSTAITNLKTAANTWAAAQTFTSRIIANGKITSVGGNSSYVAGRDNAAFRCNVTTTGYIPLASVKANTGSWEIGTYTANNELHFVFITDANYNAGTNNTTVNIVVTQDGKIQRVTAPAANSNTTDVPNTAWVRSVISSLAVLLTGNQDVAGYKKFTGGSLGISSGDANEGGQIDLYPGTGYGNYGTFHVDVCQNAMRLFADGGSAAGSPMLQLIRAASGGSSQVTVTSPANIWANNSEVVNLSTLNSFVADSRPYVEYYSHSILNQDLGASNTAFPMSAMVSNTGATYNVKVTFRNTASTARSCVVNGTTVSLAGGVGQLASRQFTLAGSGTLTIDNIATSVDVFITIWR